MKQNANKWVFKRRILDFIPIEDMLLNTILDQLKNNYNFTIDGRFIQNEEIYSFRMDQGDIEKNTQTLYLQPSCADHLVPIEENANFCLQFPVSLQSALVNALQDILEQPYHIARFFRPLYRLAHRGMDIHSFLSQIRQMMQNDVMIISSSFEIVSSTLPEDSHDGFFVHRGTHIFLPDEAITHIRSDMNFQDLVSGRNAFLVQDNFFPYQTILCGIQIDSQFIGYLCMLKTHRDFVEEDYALISYIAELSAQMAYTIPLQNNLYAYNVNDDYFLNHLLRDSGARIEELSALFGWQKYLGKNYYQLIICSSPDASKKQAQFHFYHQLQQLFPETPITKISNTCILLLYGDTMNLLTPFVRQILTDLLTLQHQHALCSFPYHEITQTSFYYKYTQRLLERNLRVGKAEIMTMEHLYLSFLREAYADDISPDQLIHPDLLFLREYDSQNGTSLYPTLKTYLELNRNVAEMSRQLYISKSTGFYRINQIRDLLHDPFDDPQRMFCYECSLRLDI